MLKKTVISILVAAGLAVGLAANASAGGGVCYANVQECYDALFDPTTPQGAWCDINGNMWWP